MIIILLNFILKLQIFIIQLKVLINQLIKFIKNFLIKTFFKKKKKYIFIIFKILIIIK
jgi:hypothetical protein